MTVSLKARLRRLEENAKCLLQSRLSPAPWIYVFEDGVRVNYGWPRQSAEFASREEADEFLETLDWEGTAVRIVFPDAPMAAAAGWEVGRDGGELESQTAEP